MQDIFKKVDNETDVIVECEYSKQFNKWIPVRRCWTTSISSLKSIKKIGN